MRPVRAPGDRSPARLPGATPGAGSGREPFVPAPAPDAGEKARDTRKLAEARRALAEEVENALEGRSSATLRTSESGDRVVSVSIPVRHVEQVLGVLTLEAGDVDETLAAQRLALMPFALVALFVSLLSSLLLHLFVARPVMRLSAAA